MSEDKYNDYSMYDMQNDPTPLPLQKPQGRLPPLGQDENRMNNKVGVENPIFVSDSDPNNGVKRIGNENGRVGTENGTGGVSPSGKPEDDHGDSDGAEQHGGHKKQKPLPYCKFVVNHHKLTFAITLGGQIFLYVITVILAAAGYDIFPLEFEGVPLYLTDDDTYLMYLAWMYRDEDPVIMKANTTSYSLGARTENNDILQLFYEGGNVLTKQRLEAIDKLEKEFMGVPKWKDYCKVNKKGEDCALPTSLIRFFDGTYEMYGIMPDEKFMNISGTLKAALDHNMTTLLAQGLLGHGYSVTETEASAPLTRTLFFLGMPLDGYDLTSDSVDDQNELVRDFQVDYWRGKLRDLFDDGLDGMDVYYSSRELIFHDTFIQVVEDMMLAVGSMVFIYIFMLFQTGSVWLTSWALFGILGSFMGCNLIYRIILDYKYFGVFHVLSIFIILGIGADNIFVFNDTWRATGHEGYTDLADRLSACFRRASSSMLITTLTTFVAFLSNALSPLLGVSAFGIFSAILVAVNYMTAIIFFPAVLIMYHMHFDKWSWPCCPPIKKVLSCRPCRGPPSPKGEKKPNPVVRFFRGPYADAVTNKYTRWIFIGGCAALLAMFIYFASTLKVNEKPIQFFRDGENYQEASELNNDGFSENLDDRNVEMYVVFGLENQDRGGCHKTEFDCKGTTVWDNSFDMNPKHAQKQLTDLCNNVRTLPEDPEYDILRLQRVPSRNNEVQIECFIMAMDDYMTDVGNGSATYGKGNFSLPVSEIKYQGFFREHEDLYNMTLIYDTNFYRYFETVKSYWLQNGYTGTTTDDYNTYSVKLGESRDQYDTAQIKDPAAFGAYYGTRMRYAAIVIETTLIPGILTFDEGLDMMDAWDEVVKREVARLPPSLHGGVLVTPDRIWHDFKVKRTLAETAAQGIFIGVGLAFVVLTIATGNIIISSMATMTIALVTATITGLIPLLGWKLSVIESINLSLVVGLAVDYVVHLSESYNHCPDPDRKDKVRFMLEHMGVSVSSGACSTMGSSIFMMFARLQFFFQFGVFVFCTIGFSLLYSMCLFTPLLGVFGPMGTTGSLKPLVRRVVWYFKGRHKDDPDCATCKGKGYLKAPTDTHL